MADKVVEVVRTCWIVSKSRSRKFQEMSTISRMASAGIGARNYVLILS